MSNSEVKGVRAWRPNWVRSEATRYAWKHDADWHADALANGGDPAQRLRLLNAAVAIFANRPHIAAEVEES